MFKQFSKLPCDIDDSDKDGIVDDNNDEIINEEEVATSCFGSIHDYLYLSWVSRFLDLVFIFEWAFVFRTETSIIKNLLGIIRKKKKKKDF